MPLNFLSDISTRLNRMAGECLAKKVHIKVLLGIMSLLIVHFQYRIWFGMGSMQEIREYQQELDMLHDKAARKRQRNNALYAEMKILAKENENTEAGREAIEEIARYDLGMIKKDETFFQVIE